jgi:probable phosphoglycerate mutase
VTRVILVRHGESNATVARRIGGFRTCSGLSPLGRRQAQRLHDRWVSRPEFGTPVLISSQFARARETAEIIAPSLGGAPIEIAEGFGEHDPGERCDGMTFDDFVREHGDIDWQADPELVGFPGGETVAQFHRRVRSALDELVACRAGETVVIVCHGGVVDVVMRRALSAPFVGGFSLWTLNTSITELTHRDGVWTLMRYNDHAHLVGLEAATPAATG